MNNQNKKYELTDETMEYTGHTLYRIRALRDFGDVKKSELGGWIESEDNLSHDGECWVYDEAKVFDHAEVCNDAKIRDNAWVRGDAWVGGNAKAWGNSNIRGDTIIY